MRSILWIGIAAAALTGCVQTPDTAGTPPAAAAPPPAAAGTPAPVPLVAGAPPPPGMAAPPPPPPWAPPPRQISTGSPFLAGLGTPFFIIFKIPVCIVTVAIAGPIAGISALAGPSNPQAVQVRRGLGEGVTENCGPPYVLSP